MNTQSDSYENIVAHHGLTSAEFESRAIKGAPKSVGTDLFSIPVEDRLRAYFAQQRGETVIPRFVTAPILTTPTPAPVPLSAVSPVIAPREQSPTMPPHGWSIAETSVEDESDEFTDDAPPSFDALADIGDCLEIYGVNHFRHGRTLTLICGEAEVEITQEQAAKDARRALLGALAPLGLFPHRREIWQDWRMLFA